MSDAPAAPARPYKWLRVAVALVLVGIACELVALSALGPATFMIFVFIGLPCMGIGTLIYVVHVWRQLRRKDAL